MTRPLLDQDLAWLEEGEPLFADYVEAVAWAQDFARHNREVMMAATLRVLREQLPPFQTEKQAINCHHNYVEREQHFGEQVWVTRKGAVRRRRRRSRHHPGLDGRQVVHRARQGQRGELPVVLARRRARPCRAARPSGASRWRITSRRPQGVECRKDAGVIDETPMAYKDIDAVMAAQTDLVEVVHTLRQVVCVKG